MPALSPPDLLAPGKKLLGRLGLPGHRRVWAGDDGHAQIEARAIDHPPARRLRRRLQEALEQLDAVHWAEVNALTKRVAVAFDGDPSTLERVLAVVEGVERDEDARDQLGTSEHPGDDEPLQRELAALVGDVLGLGASLTGRLLRLTPLPIELASLTSFVQNQPWLREQIERALGPQLAEVLLALATAVANGAAQGPSGLVVDMVHRTSLVTEIAARKRVWEHRERELYEKPRERAIGPPNVEPRPTPLPQGPVEQWSNRVSLAGVGGFAATLAVSRDPRRAADAFLAAAPKAARLGREAFAAQLGRSLADRGVVPLDPSALRRLDRVDTVVVDSAVLVTDRSFLGQLITFTDDEPAQLRARAEALLAGGGDEQDGWALPRFGDVDEKQTRLARGAKARARQLRRSGAHVRALVHDESVVAVVAELAELAPGATALAEAIRRCGHRFLVAGRRGGAGHQLGADDVVTRGARLPTVIRDLQADNAVVALIARRGKAPLAAADVAIGLMRRSGRVQWSADLLCGHELAEAAFIVDATRCAREVSRRGAQLALGGSCTGALTALVGPRASAGRRAATMVNGAAATAMAVGTWSALMLARKPQPIAHERTLWHELDAAEVIERLETSTSGLAEAEVRHRQQSAGQQEPGPHLLEPFLAELANPLTPLLGAGAALSAAVGSIVDAGMVAGLIGANAVVGGLQRARTDTAITRLLRVSGESVRVVRDGQERWVPADELVPGDVVDLAAGEPVPADCVLLESDALEVNEATLTGESLPVAKSPGPTPEAVAGDRTGMLYEGTTVAAGRATAVVVETGATTEAGRGLALASHAEPPPSGVEERLRSLTRKVLPLAGVAGVGVIGTGILRAWPLRELVGAGVNLAVASVPEGLPFIATAGQLSAARRLSTRGALVRNPRTIEALGRVDVLCFDKTGTLTQGRIRLQRVSDIDAEERTGELTGPRRKVLAAALRATPQPGNGHAANATDDAVMAAAVEHDVEVSEGLPGAWEPVTELPFEAGRGLVAVLGTCQDGQRLSVKGAPEALLPQCTDWARPAGRTSFDDGARTAVSAEVERLAKEGYRVLAVAERVASDRTDLDAERVARLEFLGLLTLADPVRPSAAAAVTDLRAAGVDVLMVTGDHPSTAEAIAGELDILDGRRVLTGAELDELDEAGLDEVLPHVAVVARVTPAQKVRIVEGLQRAGRVVAMTGDGANDAPSIRLADVGVALGRRATPAARAAADVVVTDERIETIIDALVEGRALWGAVREALGLLVGGNLGEIGFTLLASAFSRRSPLRPRQLLLVNLLTDLAPALAIAVRPPGDHEPGRLLREGPEQSLGTALNRDITLRAATTTAGATVGWTAARLTGSAARARTVGLVALVGTQLGQTVAAGGSPLVLATGVGSAALLAGIVQTPGVSHFFGCRPLGPLDWTQAVTGAALATGAGAVAGRLLARRERVAAA